MNVLVISCPSVADTSKGEIIARVKGQLNNRIRRHLVFEAGNQ